MTKSSYTCSWHTLLFILYRLRLLSNRTKVLMVCNVFFIASYPVTLIQNKTFIHKLQCRAANRFRVIKENILFFLHLRSSMCGFAVCFFCLSPPSGSSVRTRKVWCSKRRCFKLIFTSPFEKSCQCRSVFIYSLGGSVSMLLRPCWEVLPSVTLAGLFFTLFSPELHTSEINGLAQRLVCVHTTHSNSPTIHTVRGVCRPVGLCTLLSRRLQCTLWKVFQSSFIFFTAKRKAFQYHLKIEREWHAWPYLGRKVPQSEGNDRARFSLTHGNGDTLMIIHEIVFIWVTNTTTTKSTIIRFNKSV